jgi:L-alanine-DL-glutamate epimerase-like enolase superfamily enzyme
MNLDPELNVRGLVRAVDVPMNRPLLTGGGEVGSAAMVLIDLLTEEGVTGCTYLFCPTPLVLKPLAKLLSNLSPLIEGDLLAPVEIERKLQKTFRLLGPQGLGAMAMAGIEMAAWDALAKSCEMPLVRLLGGQSCRIPAYNSCGSGFAAPCPAASFEAGVAVSVVPSGVSLRASSRAAPWVLFASLCGSDGGLGCSAEQPLDKSTTVHAEARSAFMPVVGPPKHAPMRPIPSLPDPFNQRLQA